MIRRLPRSTSSSSRTIGRPGSTAGYRCAPYCTCGLPLTCSIQNLEFVRLQGITALPKLNMAHHPKLFKRLGLDSNNVVRMYDTDGSSFIHEDVDHVMEVTAYPVILTQLDSVKNCLHLNKYIKRYCLKRPAASPIVVLMAPSTMLNRKAAADGYGAFPPSLKTSQPSAFPRPSTPSSPELSSPPSSRASSPFSTPDPIMFFTAHSIPRSIPFALVCTVCSAAPDINSAMLGKCLLSRSAIRQPRCLVRMTGCGRCGAHRSRIGL
ncbi:hypothetical protein K438DRAFT_1828936 [Mycena galopus ATCC 62051]|nr:hypothetical protein K438DRAFT_1828936 [Mycena galopus ATCC 62051]